MGVYIKDMEMPVIATEWSIRRAADGRWYAVADGEWHELVPVPPHGRLGDLDKLADNMRSTTAGMEHRAIIMHEIRRAPTILPAEEGET